MARRRVTRAVTIVRRTVRRRSSGGGRFGMGGRIPVAVLMGLAPGLKRVYEARNNGATGPNGWFDIGLRAYTGISPSNATGQGYFSWYWLQFGALPLLAGLAVHGVANKFGLNRIVRRFVPIVEI